MKPQKLIFVLIISFVALFFSCQDAEVPKPLPDANYPTTYPVLSQQELAARNSDFQEIKIHDGLNLNKYGFVEGVIHLNIDTITREFVKENIDTLLKTYGDFLGIRTETIFDLDRELTVTGKDLIPGGRKSLKKYFDQIEFYRTEDVDERVIQEWLISTFYLTQRKLENKSIIGNEITFNFDKDNNRLKISGNWLPQAFIPKNNIYSEEEATERARYEVYARAKVDIEDHWDELHVYKTLLKVLNKNNNIEIRDCWRIGYVDIPYYGYTVSIFIDSQTGNVVKYSDKLY